jgi:hypothetical protein
MERILFRIRPVSGLEILGLLDHFPLEPACATAFLLAFFGSVLAYKLLLTSYLLFIRLDRIRDLSWMRLPFLRSCKATVTFFRVLLL